MPNTPEDFPNSGDTSIEEGWTEFTHEKASEFLIGMDEFAEGLRQVLADLRSEALVADQVRKIEINEEIAQLVLEIGKLTEYSHDAGQEDEGLLIMNA